LGRIAGVNKIQINFFNLSLVLDTSIFLMNHAAVWISRYADWAKDWRSGMGMDDCSDLDIWQGKRGTRLRLHGRQIDHSHPSSVEVKNQWRPTYIYGMFLYCGT
jgi:hypothetical protein